MYANSKEMAAIAEDQGKDLGKVLEALTTQFTNRPAPNQAPALDLKEDADDYSAVDARDLEARGSFDEKNRQSMIDEAFKRAYSTNTLDLSNMCITLRELQNRVIPFLTENKIHTLDIYNSTIGNQGAVALAEVASLRHLKAHSSRITQVGAEALTAALAKGSLEFFDIGSAKPRAKVS